MRPLPLLRSSNIRGASESGKFNVGRPSGWLTQPPRLVGSPRQGQEEIAHVKYLPQIHVKAVHLAGVHGVRLHRPPAHHLPEAEGPSGYKGSVRGDTDADTTKNQRRGGRGGMC